MLVRDLIAILANVDPDLNVRMSMNMEYTQFVHIGSVCISGDSLYFDDVPADTVGDTVLYSI